MHIGSMLKYYLWLSKKLSGFHTNYPPILNPLSNDLYCDYFHFVSLPFSLLFKSFLVEYNFVILIIIKL